MKTLTINDILTLSITVTEEISESNLHSFLRTSIINSTLTASTESSYYFYYNANTFTYEIIICEKLSDETSLEPFLLMNQFGSIGDEVKILLFKNYFMVTQYSQLLILKKVNKIDKEEIPLYIKQIYKIEKFEIIDLSLNSLNDLLQKKVTFEINKFYPLYPQKTFYYFMGFVIIALFILITLLFVNNKEYTQTKFFNPTHVNNTNYNQKKLIQELVELFNVMKLNSIHIEKIGYLPKKLKTILYNEKQSALLQFANTYTKRIQVKSLRYNEEKKLYVMEVILAY